MALPGPLNRHCNAPIAAPIAPRECAAHVSPIAHIALALGALAVLTLVWMTHGERRLFRVRRVALSARDLGLPPMRVLHLTDTHFYGRDAPILSFLGRLAQREEFDLVLMTGDLIDRAAGIESAARAARLFAPRLGCLAVLGGHDYSTVNPVRAHTSLVVGDPRDARDGENPVAELAAALEEAGARVLSDEHVVLYGPDGRRLAVVGLRDAYAFTPDAEAAWDGLPPELPTIVIAHSPDVLPEVTARGAKLAFFGHTHGGQVRLPLVGALVTRTKLPRRLARGAFRRSGTAFIVSSGLGAAPSLPYRLFCPPEVVVVEITEDAAPDGLTPLEEAGDA